MHYNKNTCTYLKRKHRKRKRDKKKREGSNRYKLDKHREFTTRQVAASAELGSRVLANWSCITRIMVSCNGLRCYYPWSSDGGRRYGGRY